MDLVWYFKKYNFRTQAQLEEITSQNEGETLVRKMFSDKAHCRRLLDYKLQRRTTTDKYVDSDQANGLKLILMVSGMSPAGRTFSATWASVDVKSVYFHS